ncbi:MAG: phosphatase PAP2 family protein, partial [Bacteroidia bacterium]
PTYLLKYLLACTGIVAAVFLINSFNKISIHLATMGALSGLLAALAYKGYADFRILLALAILASGYVASARLSLKAHLPNQLYLGFLLGFIFMFFILNLNFKFA